MTCIAWDGETLAADKLACSGEVRGTVTKIFRVFDAIVGVTGNLSVGMEMIEWYRAGARPADFPAGNRNLTEGCSLVVVKSDKTVWKYESSPYPFMVEGKFSAFGCGSEAALVAMACGRDSTQAVALAAQFNTGCGNGIDSLRFS